MKDKLVEAVNKYFLEEFGEDSLIEKVPDDGIIHLAYTTYDFGDGEEREVQVDFDVLNLKYLNYIDGDIVLEETRDCEQAFIDEIKYCDFNDIIRECVHIGFDKYEQ